MSIKISRRLRNYRARTKSNPHTKKFYCGECGKVMSKLACETFKGICWLCSIKDF